MSRPNTRDPIFEIECTTAVVFYYDDGIEERVSAPRVVERTANPVQETEECKEVENV